MKKREKITLYLWLLFSLFICVQSWRLGLGTFKSPGPGFLPFGVALAIALFSIILLLKERGKQRGGAVPPLFQTESLWKVVLVICLLFLYPFSLKLLGFFLSTLFFMGVALKMIELQKWKLVTVAASVVFYTLFLCLVANPTIPGDMGELLIPPRQSLSIEIIQIFSTDSRSACNQSTSSSAWWGRPSERSSEFFRG
jgi:hypothetical protein